MNDYEKKLFVAKYQLAVNKMRKSMTDLYKLAKQHGINGRDGVLHDLHNKVSQASGIYYGTYPMYAVNFVRQKCEVKKPPVVGPIENARNSSIAAMIRQMRDKVSKVSNWKINTSFKADECGVTLTEYGEIKRIVVPVTYSLQKNKIGDLSSNKVLVWAKPHKHDTYTCWKANYLTWKRKHGSKVFQTVDCYIMKDETSGIVYHHTDYRLCADGMRRSIGRAISKRIG